MDILYKQNHKKLQHESFPGPFAGGFRTRELSAFYLGNIRTQTGRSTGWSEAVPPPDIGSLARRNFIIPAQHQPRSRSLVIDVTQKLTAFSHHCDAQYATAR
ncbi:hypothetical protein K449DRAFT_427673 [Hypoxylon sp. EC38]|nr:hypothetical protein K449DRAFT_427673 [Hypoxylon sp. EC38]